MTPPALALDDVWVYRSGRPVLEGLSLTVQPGHFLGIIGPNGGGKTTLLKVVLGLIVPSRGTVSVLGRSPGEARGKVGYVPQHFHFDTGFPVSVIDVVLMGRLALVGPMRPYGSVHRGRAHVALEEVGIADLADRPIGSLSGGQLQRVMLARALVTEPKVLLLDEPTSSLDTRVGRDVYDLLGRLAEEMTVILVSHDIGVITRHVETIACLNQRLHYHHSKELTGEMIEAAYGCPVDLVAHGHPHRVLEQHPGTDVP